MWARWWVPALLAASVVAVYWNHFDGEFHFDDDHTVQSNLYIRNLDHWRCFFFDGAEPCNTRAVATFSSLAVNSTYRPIVTLSLAIDYALGDGLEPFWFHADNFASFLVCGLLLFFVLRSAIARLRPRAPAALLAWAGVAWFMLHPVSAETVNYVIARSDLYSTAAVLAGLALWTSVPLARRLHLYLLPVALGILAKVTAIMFLPLLAAWLVFIDPPPLAASGWRSRLRALAVHLWPSLLVCGAGYALVQYMHRGYFNPGAGDALHYILTQPLVHAHYAIQWILPLQLSADTDWQPIRSAFDTPAILGYVFWAVCGWVILSAVRKDALRPYGFGLFWFLVALAPTTFVPLAEVMNDHRIFFPAIGLVLVGTTWGWDRFERIPPAMRSAAILLAILALGAYAYGARVRCAVWATEESLWEDVTQKSPNNGRGHMNYGLALMAKGDFAGAEARFRQTLALLPSYPYVHTNLGIALSHRGATDEADWHFRQSILLGESIADVHYHYGRFLSTVGRTDEAVTHLRRALELSDAHVPARELLMRVYLEAERPAEALELARSVLRITPSHELAAWVAAQAEARLRAQPAPPAAVPASAVDAHILQGLEAYNQARWNDALASFAQAAALNPQSAEAHNNLCATYNQVGQWARALDACRAALAIRPDFPLAQGNMAQSLHQLRQGALPPSGATPAPAPEAP